MVDVALLQDFIHEPWFWILIVITTPVWLPVLAFLICAVIGLPVIALVLLSTMTSTTLKKLRQCFGFRKEASAEQEGDTQNQRQPSSLTIPSQEYSAPEALTSSISLPRYEIDEDLPAYTEIPLQEMNHWTLSDVVQSASQWSGQQMRNASSLFGQDEGLPSYTEADGTLR